MSVRTLGIIVGAALLSVSACSGNSTNTPSPSPSSVQSKVVLTTFDPTLEWIPTQFAPKIVERQSVSAVGQWPKDGDAVTILCALQGEPYGKGDTKWYRIVVPPEKLNPETKGQAEEITGGYRAYLEAMWLPDAQNVPNC